MTEVEIAPSFGAELKDGFKPVNAWVAGGIAWLSDIEQFYRERHAIEKEYSQKLNALAKKYYEKKSRKTSSLSVGDTPTATPGSLESASMTTWTVQLTTLESRAAEHERFANALVGQVAEPLKHLAAKYEDLRKSHADYAAKLEKERDGSYGDLKKIKSKYDSVCQEVENKRKKTESGFDHGKQKAQAAFQQQQAEMRNMKNTYLIAINVTNKQKERYYHDYVPDLLDSLQSLSEARTSALNGIWLNAASLETQAMKNSTQVLDHLSAEIPRNNPLLDSMMFVRHNAGQWQDPPDFGFEPAPVWLDDDVMASDPMSKTFLMNILSKSKSSLSELRRECDAKRKEVEGAKRVRQAIREGKDKRDEVEVVRAQFHQQELLHEAERKRVTAEVEVSTITSAVGDISVGARNHRFKNQTYKIPTSCDLCGDRLWGLNAKGMSCEDCGYTCHTKCELKVPADCPGELNKEQKKSAKASRQAAAQAAQAAPPPATSNGEGAHDHNGLQRSDTIGSMNTLSSGYAASATRSVSGMTIRSSAEESSSTAPTSHKVSSSTGGASRHRVMAPPPASYIKPGDENGSGAIQKGRMLYAYQPSGGGDGEISISEGEEFTLVEPDDGSGWIKIKPHAFGSEPGLVPASYAEMFPSSHEEETTLRPTSVAASHHSATGSVTGGSDDGGRKKKQGPAVAPRRRGGGSTSAAAANKKHVEALYTYQASGPGEVDMEEGEKMVLVKADEGDGWCEVESRAGRGIVPATWVKEV